MAKINFIGGASTVTGSCIVLDTGSLKLMIDCGMMQDKDSPAEEDISRVESMPKVDILLLTHSHIDHSGLIPLLVKKKKVSRIISTPATRRLCELLLEDSSRLMAQETDQPAYSQNDVQQCFVFWDEIDSGKAYEFKDTRITFYDSSHMLGSASVFVETNSGNYLFSGDIGTKAQKLMQYPPQVPSEPVDYLIMESTYGDKTHKLDDREHLAEIVNSVCGAGGKVLIPAFAVGRLQEILYALAEAKIPYPVYVDTPMGEKVTALFDEYRLYLEKRLRHRLLEGSLFGDYKTINTQPQHLELAQRKEPCVIVSASGMLEGGRVLDHLQNIKDDPKSAIVFVGYQADGTLGRRILNKEVPVSCKLFSLSCFSAHADSKELIDYVFRLSYLPYKVFLVHGEQSQRKMLQSQLKKRKIRVELPKNGEIYQDKLAISGKPLKLSIPSVSFTKIYSYKIAPLFCYLVDHEEYMEIVDEQWYQELIGKKKAEHLGILSADVQVQDHYNQISYEEIEKALEQLFNCGVISKNRLREFWAEYLKGETAAKKYVVDVHKKNPNTGLRRWNPPNPDCTEDPEALYELAYNSMMSATTLKKDELYRLLSEFVPKL